ncbi:MAG: Non-specific serine/threonine protein kinase [Pseudomonadota bacterium]|nr:Non-specific serine/threonine protein kinase [Pseudomonadota bacterium]
MEDFDPLYRVPAIPGYRMERLISGGAMGQVYLAIQETLERPVAIKIINPGLNTDTEFRQRFLKEGKIIAQLRHPHIVTIHDIGEYESQYYMVMEYIEGGTLKHRMEKGLSAEPAVGILRQLASALGHAHRQGFIHRDVKPANILFRDDDNAVLTDFGIAKACEDNAPLTATGFAIGTVVYMSPEQAQGTGLDGRSDLYSLGLVFFEMLTGFRPKRTPEGATESLPVELSHYQFLLDRLLAPDPDDRFATAEELIEAIDRRSAVTNNGKTIVLPSGKPPAICEATRARPSQWTRMGVALFMVLAIAVSAGYFINQQSLNPALPVEVSYTYRPVDQLNFRPLKNDSVLRSGDHYQIRFTAEQNGYVYIFQIDSGGAIYQLFPFEKSQDSPNVNINPVQAGATYFIPAEDEAFQLDEQIGQEQIYVLAFQKQHSELENQYRALAEARRDQDQARITASQSQLIDSLQKNQVGTKPVLKFKHSMRGSHDL